MKPRERLLLIVFSALFLCIVGGGLMMFSLKHYRSVVQENDQLRDRLAQMQSAISQGAEWQRRSDWLQANMPAFSSQQEASARLLDVVQKEASKAGVSIASKEFINRPKPVMADGAPSDEPEGYFDNTAVRLTLTGVKEKELFAWIHAMQSPTSLLGITRFQINPSGQGKTVNCEIDITQYYRENQAPKLTRAN